MTFQARRLATMKKDDRLYVVAKSYVHVQQSRFLYYVIIIDKDFYIILLSILLLTGTCPTEMLTGTTTAITTIATTTGVY